MPADNANNDDQSVDSKSDETTGWALLLDSAKEFDRKMLEDWQNELANLLTFIGLFSAIVTGFVVFSIPTLQADTGGRAVTLLSQISHQVSSLTTTANMINSTFRPSSDPPPLIPRAADIKVNILWVGSLGVSLMAAFWTVTVQQWLRYIPLQQKTTVRRSASLRQLRYDGLMKWRVAVIVALLPLAVQLALLLFLAGLLLFLREIEHSVTIILGVCTALSSLPFFISLPLPLFWPACPYKSPFIPVLWQLTYLLRWSIFRLLRFIFLRRNNTSVDPQGRSLNERLELFIRGDVRSADVDAGPHTFWHTRELAYLDGNIDSTTGVPDLKRGDNVAASALAFTPFTVSRSKRGNLVPCLRALPEHYRIKAVTHWISRDLGLHDRDLKAYDYSPRARVDFAVVPTIIYLETGFHARSDWAKLVPIMLEAIPDKFARVGMGKFAPTISVLALLYRGVELEEALKEEFIPKILVGLSKAQNLYLRHYPRDNPNHINDNDRWSVDIGLKDAKYRPHLFLATVLLFHCSSEGRQCRLTFEQTTRAADVFVRCMDIISPEDTRMDEIDIGFAASAALAAVATVLCGLFFPEETPPLDNTRIGAFIQNCDSTSDRIRRKLTRFLATNGNRERPPMITRFRDLSRTGNEDYKRYYIEKKAIHFLRSLPRVLPIAPPESYTLSQIHDRINTIIEAVAWLYGAP